MPESPYQIVIGLEVHVQLQTQTKLFCSCSTAFGQEPNTQTCPVCTGLPGALPVMNREAFRLALRTAVALDCEIPEFTKWDRKNYFYPDLPKGYQISQFDLPMSQHGRLRLFDPKDRCEPREIRILRAHLEEDAGKSIHDEAAGRHDTRIDLNRTGTPLLEIVSQPDIRSPLECRAYLNELKLLLTYIGVSDCNMQEGSLRVDANINLHIPQGDQVIETPIVEVKNMNSFRAVQRAMEYEAERQYAQWQRTGQTKAEATKQTWGWNDQEERTELQRAKEESSDYRYFPDPDLLPVVVTPAEVAEVKSSLGELPAALRQRLQDEYELDTYGADVIVNQGREVANYFVATAEASGDRRKAGNWVQQEVLRTLKDEQCDIEAFAARVPASQLAALIQAVSNGRLDNSRAKDVFTAMHRDGSDVDAAMKSLGIEEVDRSDVEDLCRELLEANPRVIADVKGGKQQAVGALIGQAKKRNPNANPNQVRETLLQLIAAMPD
ncbi:MAG: Asp-tRNA(Asn)/Glu-tRNA(Gln) amidotransferase subunit GatB [Planctomycetales bacterium]|nr:Asp-tRNA(Asn)/Glu-tRNA(Gln) amidotransferase subunit GatB [Planctomycetales bacterium]